MQTFDADEPEQYYLFVLQNVTEVPVVQSVVDLTAGDDERDLTLTKIKTEMGAEQMPMDVEQIPITVKLERLKRSPVYSDDEDDEPITSEPVTPEPIADYMVAGPSHAYMCNDRASTSTALNGSVPVKIEPMVERRIVILEDVILPSATFSFKRNPSPEPIERAESPSDVISIDDDDEVQWSQQIALQIKQEVNVGMNGSDDENFAESMQNDGDMFHMNSQEDDDDFEMLEPKVIIEEEEEDDDDDSAFTNKLSQDQDKIERIKINGLHKRKQAKEIEAMPMPKRRRSCSEREAAPLRQPSSNRSPDLWNDAESNVAAPSTSSPPSGQRSSARGPPENASKYLSKRSHTERMKGSSERKSTAKSRISKGKSKKSRLTDDQKGKLHDIALKAAKEKTKTDKRNGPKPKVKESRSRSGFLTAEQPPKLIQARRKSTDISKGTRHDSNGIDKPADYFKSIPATSSAATIKPSTSAASTSKPATVTSGTYETVLKPKNVPIKRISRIHNGHGQTNSASNGGTSNEPKSAMGNRENAVAIQPLGQVDPNDPFKRNLKINSEQKPAQATTFDEVMRNIPEKVHAVPKRKSRPSFAPKVKIASPPRIASDQNANKLHQTKSILRTARTCKPKRGITFQDPIEHCREFETGPGEDDEVLIPVETRPLSQFQRNPLHAVISAITNWNVDWLESKRNSPPVNGDDYIVSPMLTEYVTFETYQR